jgi:hypothetical protein
MCRRQGTVVTTKIHDKPVISFHKLQKVFSDIGEVIDWGKFNNAVYTIQIIVSDEATKVSK